MPETFYDYLRRSPEVFSWYRTLTGPDALEFEQRIRSQFEAGHSVAVQIPSPIVDIFEQPAQLATDACFILYPPVDRFLRAPSQNDLSVPISWIAVPRPQRRYTIFVPYHCFQTCANCLETPDLRVVLVRVIRVLRYLEAPVPGPYDYIIGAEKWRNCRQALVRYGIYCAEEYVERGGSNKVLEYLKPRVRRREWHKPDWVYDTNELEHQREHLMFRGYKRIVKNVWHKTQVFTQTHATTMRNCDENDLNYIWSEIKLHDPDLAARYSMTNFYSQYSWNVNAHRGNFE